jgi:ATP-dependent DNA helicase RecG
VEVRIEPDRIEILSYPGPLPPLNEKTLMDENVTSRNYRNRRIGDFLKELHLTEGRNTGFRKIRSAMRNNGSPDPVFKTDLQRSYFLTILPINPEANRRYEAEREEAQVEAQVKLTGTKLKIMSECAKNHCPKGK